MVCTGNICRSPMATGLLQNLMPADLRKITELSSAGTHALHGQQAAAPAIQAMIQLGFDIRQHRARQLTPEIGRRADLLVAMETMHLGFIKRLHIWNRPHMRLLGEFGPNPDVPEIEDPYGGPLQAYQACIENMRPCIDGLIQWLRTEIGGSLWGGI